MHFSRDVLANAKDFGLMCNAGKLTLTFTVQRGILLCGFFKSHVMTDSKLHTFKSIPETIHLAVRSCL